MVVTMNPTCDMHTSHVICMQAMVLIDTWYVSANDLIVIILQEDAHSFCSFLVAKLAAPEHAMHDYRAMQ